MSKRVLNKMQNRFSGLPEPKNDGVPKQIYTAGDIIRLGRDPDREKRRAEYESRIGNIKVQALLGLQDYLNSVPHQWYLTKGHKLEFTSKLEIR